MAREFPDHPLTQLDAALQVMPSPEAAARVRERVRQEQESGRVSYGWWWVAAASVALLAVGIASSMMWPRVPTPPAAVVATNTSTPVAAVATAAPDVVPGRVVPNLARRPSPPAAARAPIVFEPARPGEPEVLVPPDEGIALRKLLIALREGRATVPAQGLRVAEDADGHMLEPTPIDIPSIKIELLPGTQVVGSGGIVK